MKIWKSVLDYSQRKTGSNPFESDVIVVDTSQGRFTVKEEPDGSLSISGSGPHDRDVFMSTLLIRPRSGNVVEIAFEIRPNDDLEEGPDVESKPSD